MLILAIDPGNEESGYALVNDEYKPIVFGKEKNENLVQKVFLLEYDKLVVEMIASYGMSVGKTVFDTCVWIGRFIQAAAHQGIDADLIYRKEEKMYLCGSMTAKDKNIRAALIERFAKTENGRGTKKNPDFFYGFAADAWMAFAVACVWYDKQMEKKINGTINY